MKQTGSFNITILAVFSLVLTVLASYSVAQAQGWYNTNWEFRKTITIDADQVDATLTNFPVVIDTTDTDLAAGARSDGYDILFTDDTGTAKLDHEIEYYAAGALVAWVKVPSLASSLPDTVIYLYYGNPGATDQQNPTGVWDTNYVMVQHLEETAGNHNDSTLNSNDGTTVVVANQAATGTIDGADEFNGATNYVRVPSAGTLQFGEGSFTAEAWIYPQSIPDSGGARIVNTRGTGGGGLYAGWQFKIKSSGSNWIFGDASIDDETGNYMPYDGTTTYAYNAWYHVVMVYEADTELRFYVNGASDGTPLPVGDYGSISNGLPTVIGASLAENGSEAGPDKQFFDGIIDEVRLSNEVRSTGWIQASYNNQSAPGSFYAIGGEETQSPCTLDTDCDDGVGCTVDTCDGGTGTCVFTPDDIACDDNFFCTGVETCDPANDCQPGTGDPCTDDGLFCTGTESCDETGDQCVSSGDPCTDDGLFCTGTESCDETGDQCVSSGDPCPDDGLFCTGTESCDETGDQCVSSGDPCTDDGLFCTGTESCDETGDQCVSSGDPCPDDGLYCTGSESCDETGDQCVSSGDPCAGGAECNTSCQEASDTCFNTSGTACTDDGNVCTDDICNGAGTCSHPANTASCDDGVFCNGPDTCSGGSCLHAGDPCAGGAECNSSCQEASDTCFNTSGTACTDDGNVCTDDTCNGAGTCSHPANTASCDDGVFCNGPDTCSGGSCLHAGDPCAGGAECNTSCQEASDTCFNTSGTACTDDGNVCTDDTCNGAGACSHPANTASCDDGLFCNGPDTCSGGSCLHAGDPCAGGAECNSSCQEASDTCFNTSGTACTDDGNVCTDDTCDGAGTCSHPNNTAPCDDTVFCNGNDTCSGGTCSDHDGDPCTPQLCNEGTGTCVNCLVDGDCNDSKECTDDSCLNGFCNYINNTAPCNDGDACTTGETCYAGICGGGTPLDCDDSDVCTDDSCLDGTCLNDYNTAPCDDGDACTEGDTCTAGTCGGSTVDCDDSEVCTTDTCDAGTGCVNTPVAGSCDDGDACTEGDTCTAGTCGGSTVDCDDGDACTTDTCDTGTGCVNTPVGDGGACDDGDACTENDVCTGGSCGGSTVDCDDSEVCTTDTCDTVAGCVNTPVGDGSTCDDGFFCTDLDQCLGGECTGSGDPCVPDPCDEVNDICLTDWWDGAWLFRKAITIDPDNVDGDLTDFPVLIDLTDADLATYAQSSGNDLVFTDDNKFQLSHEITFYDHATGTLVAWVRVPDLSSTEDTVLYLYFGNSAADNQEDVAGTWDSNYVMVQHLDETEGPHFDSTSNANDGTAYDLATQDAPGKINGADAFDASGDLIDVGTDASLDVFGPGQDFSIFLWVKRNATTEVEGFFSSGSSSLNGIYFGSASSNTDDLKFMSPNNTVSIDSTTGVIGDTEWHHVGVTADRDDTLTFWVDGVPVHSESIAGTSAQDWNRADDTYKIGTDRSEMSPMDGILDEVRVSDMVMGAGWIQTSYTNQNNPGAFYLLGDLEIVADADSDGTPDVLDNCLNYPNGPLQGTCTAVVGTNLIVSTGQFCTADADCDPGEFCEMTQADTYPPGGDGIGDACDCEADFDCDSPGLDVDAMNVEQFIWDFGRSVYKDPCTAVRPCYGDFNCDGNVDADDIPKILEDFGRTLYINPCPACVRLPADWCMSP